MDIVVVSGPVSAVAACGALAFTWLTLREASITRREQARQNKADRLHRLVELAGAVAEAAKSEEWSRTLGIAQLRLLTALAGERGLPACERLTEVDAEDAFDAFIDARDELDRQISDIETS